MAILPVTPESPQYPTTHSIISSPSLENNKDSGHILGHCQWLQRSPIRKRQTTPSSIHLSIPGALQSKRISRSRRNQDGALELGTLARIPKSAKGLNASEAKKNFTQKEDDGDNSDFEHSPNAYNSEPKQDNIDEEKANYIRVGVEGGIDNTRDEKSDKGRRKLFKHKLNENLRWAGGFDLTVACESGNKRVPFDESKRIHLARWMIEQKLDDPSQNVLAFKKYLETEGYLKQEYRDLYIPQSKRPEEKTWTTFISRGLGRVVNGLKVSMINGGAIVAEGNVKSCKQTTFASWATEVFEQTSFRAVPLDFVDPRYRPYMQASLVERAFLAALPELRKCTQHQRSVFLEAVGRIPAKGGEENEDLDKVDGPSFSASDPWYGFERVISSPIDGLIPSGTTDTHTASYGDNAGRF